MIAIIHEAVYSHDGDKRLTCFCKKTNTLFFNIDPATASTNVAMVGTLLRCG